MNSLSLRKRRWISIKKNRSLESEINELLDQKQNIRKDKPLVWNIEFAEILWSSEGLTLLLAHLTFGRKTSLIRLEKSKTKSSTKSFLLKWLGWISRLISHQKVKSTPSLTFTPILYPYLPS